MVERVNPSSRIQVRGLGELLAPAVCSLCGNGMHEKYVDPAIWYEWEGQQYFCELCVTEMAELIGCLNPEESKFLMDVNAEVSARNQELELVATAYDELCNALKSINLDLGGLTGLSVPPRKEAEPVTREQQLSNSQPTIVRTTPSRTDSEPVSESADGGEKPEPKPPEPVKKPGRNDPARPSGSNEPTSRPLPTFRI